MGRYDDMLCLPHHVSERHPRMSMMDRAAQFQPFRALTGHEDALTETARTTENRKELSEDRISQLNRVLGTLAERIETRPPVTLTWFRPDEKKDGGAYVTTSGRLRRIDRIAGVLVLAEGDRIPMEDITDIRADPMMG